MMIVMMVMQQMRLVVHHVFVMEQIVWNVQIIIYVFNEVIYVVWDKEDSFLLNQLFSYE